MGHLLAEDDFDIPQPLFPGDDFDVSQPLFAEDDFGVSQPLVLAFNTIFVLVADVELANLVSPFSSVLVTTTFD